MKIFIKYDPTGEILSVAKINVMPVGLDQPFIAGEYELVLEVPAKDEFLQYEIVQFHEQYKVDVEKKKLVKK
jgi:hypothetical protein